MLIVVVVVAHGRTDVKSYIWLCRRRRCQGDLCCRRRRARFCLLFALHVTCSTGASGVGGARDVRLQSLYVIKG